MNLKLLATIAAGTLSATGFAYATPGNDLDELVNAGYVETNPQMTNGNDIAARATEQGVSFSANNPAPVESGFGGAVQSGFTAQPSQDGGFGAQGFTSQPSPGNGSGIASSVASTGASASAPATTSTGRQPFVRGAIAAVKAKRTRNVESGYKFGELRAPSEMPEGQFDAFFVPATAKMPNPAKSLTSTVSVENKKYATVVGKTKVAGKEVNKYEYNSTKYEIFAQPGPNGEDGAWIARVQ